MMSKGEMCQIPYDYSNASFSCISTPSYEAPYFDGTNYACWRAKMISYFHEMSPKIWWIVNVGFSHALDRNPQTQGQKKCRELEVHATNALFGALSRDVFSEIYKLKSVHAMWIRIQEIYEESNITSDDSKNELEIENDFSTSSSCDIDDHSSSSAPIDEIVTPSTSPHCLVAKGNSKIKFHIDDDEVVDSDNDDDDDDEHEYTYDELVELLHGMEKYFEKEKSKMRTLKEENSSLNNSLEELKRSHESLSETHEKLKEAYDSLASNVSKNVKVDICVTHDLFDNASTSCNDLCDNPHCSQANIFPSTICDLDYVGDNDKHKGHESKKISNKKIKSNKVKNKGHAIRKNKTLIPCFKCKNEVHHVRDCSSKKEAKGLSKNQAKKKITVVKCSNIGHYFSTCPMKIVDQSTLSKKKTRKGKRKCYGCHEVGHEIASCPQHKE